MPARRKRTFFDILHKSSTAYLERVSKSYKALHYRSHSSFLLWINHNASMALRESRAAAVSPVRRRRSNSDIKSGARYSRFFISAPPTLPGCFGRPVIKLRSYFQLIIVKVRERGAIRRTSGGQSVKECHFDSVRRAARVAPQALLQNLMNLGARVRLRSRTTRLASRKSRVFGTEILSGGKLPRADRCVKYYRLPLENESCSANKKCCG